MDVIAKIAEGRIREAMEQGAFDNLPGAGKPLTFDDETWIPEDLRLAYRMLKHQGFVPSELELRKEILSLRDLIRTVDDDQERLRRLREMNFKIMKLNMIRKRPLNIEDFPEYEDKVYERCMKEPASGAASGSPSDRDGRVP
jgi:DnaJ homologue, subfamily C, member 28, conserved domain